MIIITITVMILIILLIIIIIIIIIIIMIIIVTITIMRVKNDHRSQFSNLSNWKEEAFTLIYNRSSKMNYFIYFT